MNETFYSYSIKRPEKLFEENDMTFLNATGK